MFTCGVTLHCVVWLIWLLRKIIFHHYSSDFFGSKSGVVDKMIELMNETFMENAYWLCHKKKKKKKNWKQLSCSCAVWKVSPKHREEVARNMFAPHCIKPEHHLHKEEATNYTCLLDGGGIGSICCHRESYHFYNLCLTSPVPSVCEREALSPPASAYRFPTAQTTVMESCKVVENIYLLVVVTLISVLQNGETKQNTNILNFS